MPGTTRVKLPLCTDITTTGPQPGVSLYGYDILDTAYQATITGTGAVSATVQIEVSNDNIGWLVDSVSTLTLSGTNLASSGFVSSGPWQFARANITAISGTNAKVTCTVGG